MKKRIATIIFTVISFVIISSYSVYAENVVFINDNFENLSTSNWIDNTGRGTKTVEQNEDGKYMVLNSTSSYFNYQLCCDKRPFPSWQKLYYDRTIYRIVFP